MKNFILLLLAFSLFQQISLAHEIEIESFDFELLDKVSKACAKELKAIEDAPSKEADKKAREEFDSCMDEVVKTHKH